MPLGTGDDDYRAQQSIRSLANVSRPEQPTLKLALSIVNTSTARTLAPHTVANAPLITGWLECIVARDPYLADELRPVLLGERLGVVHSPELAAIWRDSLHPHLAAGEEAAPFTALTHVDATGEPFIAGWVKEEGVEAVGPAAPRGRRCRPSCTSSSPTASPSRPTPRTSSSSTPAGGPGGWPCATSTTASASPWRGWPTPTAGPRCTPPRPSTLLVNRNSYLEAESDEEVRDFAHDCLFFVNLAELAMFLEDRFDLAEERFWSLARRVSKTTGAASPDWPSGPPVSTCWRRRSRSSSSRPAGCCPTRSYGSQRVRNPLSLVDAH